MSSETCKAGDCQRPAHARGMCGTHYQRWRRTGSATLAARGERVCAEPGCGRPNYAKGHCSRHYQRLAKFGTTALVEATPAERITSNIDATPAGCWLWRGAEGVNGYGRISVDNSIQYAHRVSYESLIGPIPDGLTIDHLCRVRMCVNPDHLEPVTLAENNRRAAAAKRSAA